MPMLMKVFLENNLSQLGRSEKAKLLHLAGPTACDLEYIVIAWLGSRKTKRGLQLVQSILRQFSRCAIQGRLDCLTYQRLADIEETYLDTYVPACRQQLIQLTVDRCHRLCPCDKSPPPSARKRRAAKSEHPLQRTPHHCQQIIPFESQRNSMMTRPERRQLAVTWS